MKIAAFRKIELIYMYVFFNEDHFVTVNLEVTLATKN